MSLTMIGDPSRNGRGRLVAKYRCGCGNEKVCRVYHVNSEATKSCGCLSVATTTARQLTHGMTRTTTYNSWASMIGRCTNPKNQSYSEYAGRGILVCDHWRSFENFFADMGAKPPGTSLDRIDNDKWYSPENCRWATQKQQQRNRRSNKIVAAFSEEKTVAEWAEDHRCNAPVMTIGRRLRYGWSPERAISETPTAKHSRRQVTSC